MFGTDGVRARINTGPMTAEAIVRLALASGRWFINSNKERTGRPLVVIGKDTRVSGYMVEAALVAGFTSIGMDCRLLGPMPTAGVSYLTQSLRADLGVMISASHNPFHDNGIKLFGPDGSKLADEIEERYFDACCGIHRPVRADRSGTGQPDAGFGGALCGICQIDPGPAGAL
jgi:phosphoglucosamine mutase